MESYFNLYVSSSPDLESIPPIPQDCPSLTDCFCINFIYTHVTLPSITNATNPISHITIDESFLIPGDILCNCDEFTVVDRDHNTMFLFDTFFSVPIYVLEAVLPSIGECARQMIAHNDEGSVRNNILEMVVVLDVTTWNNVEYDSDNDNGQNQNQHVSVASQIVDSLKKLEIDDPPSSCSIEQCPICLEEFCNGSKSELIHTKCLHVFHKECIAQWLQQCIDCQSTSACPMCRCRILM